MVPSVTTPTPHPPGHPALDRTQGFGFRLFFTWALGRVPFFPGNSAVHILHDGARNCGHGSRLVPTRGRPAGSEPSRVPSPLGASQCGLAAVLLCPRQMFLRKLNATPL